MADRTYIEAPTSRYRDTFMYSADDVGAVYGPWQKPAEFETPTSSWKTHVVKQHEVGFLDILAVRYFGDGYENMWWVIAQANGIIDPEADMYPGQKILVPTRADVEAFLARARNA